MLERMPKPPHISLHLTNDVLLTLIISINLYIIAAPVWPQVTYWWQSHHTNRRSELTERLGQSTKSQHTPQPNSLIIPAMLLNQPTLEGPKSNWFDLLKQGIWRWPGSSTPDKGGNTVFLAHRFSYTGPHGAFYYLNKLVPGDKIGVIWKNKEYLYKVTSSHEVSPTQTNIENDTPDARLTLFTCTPLWNPKDRLVIVAELEKEP